MNPFDELVRCRDDFLYFAETYVQIAHPKRGRIPLKLFDYQKRLAKTYDDHRLVLVKKFRQGGFTTFTMVYCLWLAMFRQDQKIMFACRSDREAIGVGKFLTDVLNEMPEWFRPPMTQNTQNDKKFSLTSSAISFCTPEACCGRKATHLVIDEAAFIKGMDAHWKSLYPTVTDGKVFALSTINGIGNWFEETMTGALNGKNDFHYFDVDYTEHPDYNNPKWVEEMKKNLGEKGWRQEILGEIIIDQQYKCRDGNKIASDLITFVCARNLPEEDALVFVKAAKKLREIE